MHNLWKLYTLKMACKQIIGNNQIYGYNNNLNVFEEDWRGCILYETDPRNLQIRLFYFKQPVYEQLALRWQIAQQFSGLNSLSLNSNENYILKKSGVFPLLQT